MKANVMSNSIGRKRVVVFDHNRIMRPVAMYDERGVTAQVVKEGDILLTRTTDDNVITYVHGHTKPVDMCLSFVPDKIMDYIKSDDDYNLPAGGNWDGVNTVQTLALQYGLDKFLTGIQPEQMLDGILNLTSNPNVPHVGNWDINKLYRDYNFTMKDVSKSCHIDKILTELDDSYKEWIKSKNPVIPKESLNWRHARMLPSMLSVSCVAKGDGTYRYNELIVFRDNKEPEVISVFDLMNTFKPHDNNFITLPWVMDEDVKRVIYVLYDDNLTKHNGSVLWLYRTR